jgi:hypothetical protein
MKDKQGRYTLTVTETQLRAINDALEEFFRLRMGQYAKFAESIAGMGVDFSRDNPNHERIFNAYIERRNATVIALEAADKIAVGVVYNRPLPGESARICQDVWQVIRHQLWLDNPNRMDYTVDSREPLLTSNQPIAIIGKALDKE